MDVELGAPIGELPLESIALAGFSTISFELTATDDAAHDWVAGSPGHRARTLAAIEGAQSLGLEVILRTTLHRSSVRLIHHLPQALVRLGIRSWIVCWPRSADLERTVPRLGIAVPHALRAATIAGRLSIDVRFRGVPLCVLGPLLRTGFSATPELRDSATVPEPCRRCIAATRCPGLDPHYVRTHGAGELHAITTSTRAKADT